MKMVDDSLAEHQRQCAAARAFLEAAAYGDRAGYIASLDALDWQIKLDR